MLSQPLIHALDRLNSSPSAPLERLAAVRELRAELDSIEADAVSHAWAIGTSWAAIGEAAGITRQAAHARWRHLEKAS